MRKFLACFMAMLLLCGQLLAQQSRTITGRVTDANGAPIPNASILVKGTSIGTTSKADGTFSITVPPSSRILVISAVGLAEQEGD